MLLKMSTRKIHQHLLVGTSRRKAQCVDKEDLAAAEKTGDGRLLPKPGGEHLAPGTHLDYSERSLFLIADVIARASLCWKGIRDMRMLREIQAHLPAVGRDGTKPRMAEFLRELQIRGGWPGLLDTFTLTFGRPC